MIGTVSIAVSNSEEWMEDSTDSALVAVQTMVLSGEKVAAKRVGKLPKADAKVGAVSERG